MLWSPKYRKGLLRGELAKRVEELFREIAQAHDITIELEVSVDHVHIFCSFAPRYAIAQVVGRLKSESA
ncbi:MAG: IS200/IS605 family transposase [Betaproteobacteria bacterium]|nr:IS200/IS605 family transposase [Betaproteobacteria bacterium]